MKIPPALENILNLMILHNYVYSQGKLTKSLHTQVAKGLSIEG